MARRSIPIDAAAVERLRNKLGLDQVALAKVAKVSPSTVSRMERAAPGETFDLRSATKVAAALEATVEDIALAPARLTTNGSGAMAIGPPTLTGTGRTDPPTIVSRLRGLRAQIDELIADAEADAEES